MAQTDWRVAEYGAPSGLSGLRGRAAAGETAAFGKERTNPLQSGQRDSSSVPASRLWAIPGWKQGRQT
ncbi:MAG: hypothetical protein QF659_06575 [Dehalococcoidia bacterium]|nr:hypothetical protein [Dehalococcoidia bacterium]